MDALVLTSQIIIKWLCACACMRMCQVSLTCTASVHFQLTSLKFTAFKTATKLCTLSILAKNTWSSCEALDADILFASHVTHATQGSAMCTWRVCIKPFQSGCLSAICHASTHTHTHTHTYYLIDAQSGHSLLCTHHHETHKQ